MPPTGQQHYPSCPLTRNGTNGDKGSYDPLGNDRHYPYRSGGGCGGTHDTQGGGYIDPPDDPYGGDLDSSSSEFEKIM